MKTYKSTGKVVYKDDGWVILEVDNSIVNYYKSVIERMIFKKLSTPYHQAHLTILPEKHNGNFIGHPNWKKHEGERVEFEYYPTIYTDKDRGPNKYFWLVVKDLPIIGEIRKEFGLDEKLKWPIHLTVAHLGY